MPNDLPASGELPNEIGRRLLSKWWRGLILSPDAAEEYTRRTISKEVRRGSNRPLRAHPGALRMVSHKNLSGTDQRKNDRQAREADRGRGQAQSANPAASHRAGTEQPWQTGAFYGKSYFCSPRGKIIAHTIERQRTGSRLNIWNHGYTRIREKKLTNSEVRLNWSKSCTAPSFFFLVAISGFRS